MPRTCIVVLITFAGAQSAIWAAQPQAATSIAGARAAWTSHNHFLNAPDLSVNYHEFVSNLEGLPLASPDVCSSHTAPQSDVIVVDPISPSAGEDALQQSPLERVVARLQAGVVHTVYVRSGAYRLRRSLVLSERLEPLVVRACPGAAPIIEGPGGAPAFVLGGSRNTAVIGLTFVGPSAVHILLEGAQDCLVERNTFLQAGTGILLSHSSNNQISRNLIVNVSMSGIELKDRSDANVVIDNVVDGTAASETLGGGIFLHGVRDNRIAHNSIQNTAGFGIAVSNWDSASVNLGNIVEFNLLHNTALNSLDSGAIYVLGRSGVDTGIVVAGNVIDGVGSLNHHSVGIYLDDSTSGGIVTGNVVRDAGSDAVQIHGGSDNLIENNVLDLGAGRPSAILFQAAPADTQPLNLQTGNVISRNIVISSNRAPRLFTWYDGGTPTASDNFYVLCAGAAVQSSTQVVDSNSIRADPALVPLGTGRDYGPIEAAAEAIGFRPIDLSAAGVRPFH